jgi:hypothetical protein
MPVEVTSELPEVDDEPLDAVEAVVGVVAVVLEMVELMSLYVLSRVANLSAAGTQT